MKNTLFIAILALISGTISCNKADDPTNPTNPAQGPTPFTPAPSNVSGAFVGVKMKYSYTNAQIPIPVEIESEIGVGGVFTSPGSNSYVDAGTVTLNSNALDKQSNNSYMKAAFAGQTPATLGLDNSANWNIGGAGSVAAFSYNHTGSFPNYTGTLPTTITKASGLTISLGGLSNADSVYILIAAGSQSLFKRYAGSIGSVTIPASELQALPNISDNTAYLEVLPVSFNYQNIGGKDYAFIKERAVVAGVNIN